MGNDDIKRTIEEMAEALSTMSLNEIMIAYGFVLGLQANQTEV
jgi:hypothetical protein